MANQAYVRQDKIKATAHVESVVSLVDLKNGQFVELGITDETLGGEAVGVEKTAEGAKPEAIILTVHIDQGYHDYNILDQVTKPGKAARAVILEKGDVLSFLTDIAGGLVEGDQVAVAAGGLGVKKADGVDDVVIGKVIRLDYLANIGDLVVVRFK